MTKKKKIEFLRVTHLRGPNIWTYRPVLEVWVDIGELEDYPSDKIPGLYDRLTAWLPGLIEHRCGLGYRGGFLERLRDGTYAGHMLEHIVLELQTLAGMQTGFGKARSTGQRGVYKVAFRTRQEQVGRAALEDARDLLMAAINDEPFDLEPRLARLRDMVDSLCLGPSTSNIVDAAIERKIPHIRLSDGNLVQLGYGKAQRRIWTAETDRTSAVAESIASDKDLTKTLLGSCGVPVPEGRLVDSPEDAWEAAQDIGLPVVVKPYDGNHGRGVSLDLKTEKEIADAWHLADSQGNGVIVEQFIPGKEHRLLVVGKKVVAAACGEEAWVTGDGTSTLVQLIDAQLNTDPRRGDGEEFPLYRLDPFGPEGAEITLEMKRQGFGPHDVPPAGKRVIIVRNGNVDQDVTDDVHPSIAEAAALAARIVGLDIAGIDMVAEDISKPLDAQRAAIIEVNASPGLLYHLKPATGKPRNVGAAIMDSLFAPGQSGRIPLVGVAGTRGTTLISRLVGWLLHISGKHTGVACKGGMFLDRRQVTEKDCASWAGGHRLLLNPAVEAAVIENDARMILAEGLPYDRCTVGVVTDLGGHENLGEFYITDADQMFRILRAQVDVVLPDGVAVLNAGDPEVVEMASLCDGQVIFYGMDQALPAIAKHRSEGKRAVFLRDDAIVLAEGAMDAGLLPLASLKPAKAAQPETVMAAVAAAWALDMSPELIAAGLRTFDSNPKKTPY